MMTFNVAGFRPTKAPNPACCSNTSVMCPSCAGQALTGPGVSIDARRFKLTGNAFAVNPDKARNAVLEPDEDDLLFPSMFDDDDGPMDATPQREYENEDLPIPTMLDKVVNQRRLEVAQAKERARARLAPTKVNTSRIADDHYAEEDHLPLPRMTY